MQQLAALRKCFVSTKFTTKNEPLRISSFVVRNLFLRAKSISYFVFRTSFSRRKTSLRDVFRRVRMIREIRNFQPGNFVFRVWTWKCLPSRYEKKRRKMYVQIRSRAIISNNCEQLLLFCSRTHLHVHVEQLLVPHSSQYLSPTPKLTPEKDSLSPMATLIL